MVETATKAAEAERGCGVITALHHLPGQPPPNKAATSPSRKARRGRTSVNVLHCTPGAARSGRCLSGIHARSCVPPCVHEFGRYEAAKLESPSYQVDPDLCHGLPLFRARRVFVGVDLWNAELIASERRASPQFGDAIPGDPWRYERLSLPPGPSKQDETFSWKNQEHDHERQAEAQRQNTFYAVSLALGSALLAGELQSSGRLGSMVGPWTEIPAAAWRVLRVPCADSYQNWRLGHATGAGMEFWNIRIRHQVGLLLSDAATAYGPAGSANIVHRGMALGVEETDSLVSTPTALDRRMAAAGPTGLVQQRPTAEEFAKARQALSESLFSLLRSGGLVADSWVSGAARPLRPEQWLTGQANLTASSLRVGEETLEAIRVRLPVLSNRGVAAPVVAEPTDNLRTDQTSIRMVAESDCEAWLKVAWPAQSDKTKPDWWTEARGKFAPNLSEAAFSRAWANAAKAYPAMIAQGRKKRSGK